MILLLLACVAILPTAAPADVVQRSAAEGAARAAASSTAVDTTAPDAGGEGFGDWWEKHKYAVQSLVGCGLASAFLTRTLIIGVVNPPGAVLGIVGAAVMVLVCL